MTALLPPPLVPDFTFLAADDWPMIALYRDEAGTPQDLTGDQLFGDLSFRDDIAPRTVLTLANGGITDFAPTLGKIKFKAPRALTVDARPDPDGPLYFGTRLRVRILDSTDALRTIRIFTIQVLDPRTCDPRDIPQDQVGNITIAALQGEPGAPGDAYSKAEIDALLAAQAFELRYPVGSIGFPRPGHFSGLF